MWFVGKYRSDRVSKTLTAPKAQSNDSSPQTTNNTKSIFIPYWDIPEDSSNLDYARLFYFGITADMKGIIKNDDGYEGLASFDEVAAGHESYLTLRLLNSDTNIAILKNKVAQDRIISETIEAARSNHFKGVVLDFELAALPFSDIQSQINVLVNNFYTQMKANNLTFDVAVYGDTFYRKRPFDIKHIAEISDEILVMAYDFHKAYGEPGPNFPLGGKKTYGYDFKQMVDDYITLVPPNKITIVFGMYGYDWTVDDRKRPLKQAKAIPMAQIKDQFIDSCEWTNCLVQPDAISGETEIDYVDSTASEFAVNHIIWYEDDRSVSLKKVYLNKKGIGKVAYWTYGYF